MELNLNKEEAWLSINKKLCEVRESPTQRSICRVHKNYLHGKNDKAYEPAVVAIGPYHRDGEGLQMMEEHKVRCLKLLHLRNNQTVERCISAVAEMDVEARGCYAEGISLSAAEFIEMLVLDGCFILHLLKMNRHQADSTTDVVVDPIFKLEWVVKFLRRDLILFENQIPFFVLCKLFDLIDAVNPHRELVEMFGFFAGMPYSRWDNRSPHEVKHLLHLLHIFMRSLSPTADQLISCGPNRKFRLIPTATELKDANVKFRASEIIDDSLVIHFNEGQLTLTPLTIADGTEILFRNLIVYEQYFPDNKPAFMRDYAMVFDCLVNTRRDVEILSECGIIHSTMGDNQQAADIINRLTYSMPQSDFFMYGNTFKSINDHYNNRWNRARATLSRDYFHSPWAYISFAAAVLLLLLTLAQTVFSALQL